MIEGIDGKLLYEIIRDVVLVFFFAWMVLSRRQQASKDSVADLKEAHGERLTHHSDRLTKIETVIKGMPSHNDINRLHDRISKVKDETSEIKTEVSSTAALLEGVLSSVKRLNDYLIGGTK